MPWGAIVLFAHRLETETREGIQVLIRGRDRGARRDYLQTGASTLVLY